MAYCGVLDFIGEINGKPADLSRLDEGIIVAGDEEFDADEFITDEDRLDFFNETSIRTKEALLKDIDSLLEKIDRESREGAKHSAAFYARYLELVRRFRAEVEKSTFPEKLEDWWRYGYEVHESGVWLKLTHSSFFDINRNDMVDEIIDTTFSLLQVRTKLLTVEQYAQAYGVTATAVRQWIRRGKLRTAIKRGSEWCIPELAESMVRGYQSGQYRWKEYLSDLPEEYAFLNDFNCVDICQDRERKDLFDLQFSKDFSIDDYPDEKDREQFFREMQMDLKEREKFELYLIANPFVESSDACLAYRS